MENAGYPRCRAYRPEGQILLTVLMTRKAMTARMMNAGSTSCPKSLPMRDTMVDVGSFQPYFQQVVHCEGLSGAPRWTVQYDGSGPREVFTWSVLSGLVGRHR